MKNSKRVDGNSTHGDDNTPEKNVAKREKSKLHEELERSFESRCMEIIEQQDW